MLIPIHYEVAAANLKSCLVRGRNVVAPCRMAISRVIPIYKAAVLKRTSLPCSQRSACPKIFKDRPARSGAPLTLDALDPLVCCCPRESV